MGVNMHSCVWSLKEGKKTHKTHNTYLCKSSESEERKKTLCRHTHSTAFVVDTFVEKTHIPPRLKKQIHFHYIIEKFNHVKVCESSTLGQLSYVKVLFWCVRIFIST